MKKQGQYHGVFQSQQHEEKFFSRLRTLVDQFGKDNIVVCVPQHWETDFSNYEITVKLQFSMAFEIKVIASCPFVTIEETTPLFEMIWSHRHGALRRFAA
jgi:hypothetical protein